MVTRRQHIMTRQHLLGGNACMHQLWLQEVLSTPLLQPKTGCGENQALAKGEKVETRQY